MQTCEISARGCSSSHRTRGMLACMYVCACVCMLAQAEKEEDASKRGVHVCMHARTHCMCLCMSVCMHVSAETIKHE